MLINDELKKKIVDIIQSVKPCTNQAPCDICKYGKEVESYTNMSCTTLRIADALIAAGIGDVKEAEHRREVAERALLNYCKRTISFPESVAKNELDKAEKELVEERKDEQSGKILAVGGKSNPRF